VGISTTVIGGAIVLSPSGLKPAVDDISGRLRVYALSSLLVLPWLFGAVGSLANQRFFNAEDIDGRGLTVGSARARVLSAILQNTLEQVVLALSVHVCCSLLLPFAWLPAVPASAMLFALGRALFCRGYARGAPGRALGFGLTFYPTVTMFCLAAGTSIRTQCQIG
jgi:hypothetical protein